MSRQKSDFRAQAIKERPTERGTAILQLVIAVAIAVVLASLTFMGISGAQSNMRMSKSARLFASYVEKARIDAVRRHGTSSVSFLTDNRTYRINMDWDGTGTPRNRDLTFEDGVSLLSLAPPTIQFDWRGRISQCTATFALQSTGGDQVTVDVTGSGDVTVDSDITDLPTISYSNVNKTYDIQTDSTINGNAAPPTVSNTSDCTNATSGGSGTSITGTGTGGCTLTANPSSFIIRKNGGGTATVAVTSSVAGKVTASTTNNLRVNPSNLTLAAGVPGSFTVQSINVTRGTFSLTFSNTCTSVTTLVTVK